MVSMARKALLEDGPDNEVIINIRDGLITDDFSTRSWWSEELLDQSKWHDSLKDDIHRHVVKRFNETLKYSVPWCSRVIDFPNAKVLEVGCGTGSSTAAYAAFCRELFAYDIDEGSTKAAKTRCRILGVDNADIQYADPTRILDSVQKEHAPESLDVIIMFAVLEHQTDLERIESLELYWSRLKKGGHLVIAETPNRLTYFDWHTSKMSFFHILPKEIQFRYLSRVPRKDFSANVITQFERNGYEAAMSSLSRWGQSVSFHDIEIVVGDLRNLTVLDGFEPEILEQRPIRPEETLLHNYFLNKNIGVPLGYARYSLDVVLQK